MTRALLVCPEPLGHRQPAGVGIRFLEMAKTLTADGHSVTLLSPDAGNVDRCAARADTFTPENLLRYSSESDVAVIQGHTANDFAVHARPIPTVIDLYDCYIVENFHYLASHGAYIFNHDHATIINSLLRGDFFLCASEAQRLFYLGMLLAVGRVNPAIFESDPRLESLLRIAPFGVPPPRERSEHRPQHPRVLFGGIYDWYDPILAIDAVTAARKTLPDLTLTFNAHPNPDTTPQGKLAEALNYAKKLEYVRFQPWAPYAERGENFDRFTLALLTFRQSLETDLSMRTRIWDFLWGGLPVVTSSAQVTDAILERYGAGVVVPSNTADDLAAAIVKAASMDVREGTRRFALDHQWPVTLAPLLDFVRNPLVDPYKETFAVRMQVPERPLTIFDRLKRRIGGAF